MSKTVQALSVNYNDVFNAMGGLADGDTLVIPAGTASWTQTLAIAKGITVKGATTCDTSTGVATDRTIILDDIVRNAPVFRLDVPVGKSVRLSGVTIRVGSVTANNLNGAIVIANTCQSLRMDNLHLGSATAQLFQTDYVRKNGTVWGVIDHCIFEVDRNQSFNFNDPAYGGGTFGDASWAADSNFGSEEFLFVEDCYLKSYNTGNSQAVTDGTYGGRICIRHNKCFNLHQQNHGTESGRYRGFRCFESYNNTFDWSINPGVSNGGSRSGVHIMHHNTSTGLLPNTSVALQAYRSFFKWKSQEFPRWGGATGDNPWDVNATRVDGSHHDGEAAYLFDSGTCTANTTKTLIQDSTKNWNTNQWVGFCAKRVSDNQCGLISANTAKTLTVVWYSDSGGGALWTAGDQYQIHKAVICLDQPGRGKSDLLAGDPPTNTVLGGQKWPRNQLEPCYSWLELAGATHIGFSAPDAQRFIQQNRDYYNQNTSFTGVTGVGVGLLSARPSSGLVAGVGYWATDTETLYVATGPTAWVVYYTPYTYPHPLVSGVVATPNITSVASTTFTVGVAGSFTFTTSGFSSSPTFSKTGTLPSGVSLNTSTGVLSGTPGGGTAGTYNITVSAINGGESDSQPFVLTVAAATTKIIALSGSMAFGTVDVGTTLSKTLTISNNGNTDLTVSGITFPSGYSGDWTSGTIVPGGSQAVVVTFAPSAGAGATYNGTITVASDKTSGTNTTSTTGVGGARIIAITGTLAFGAITTGQMATQQMTISNSGNVALSVSQVTYPTGFSGDFSSGTIAAGGSQVVNVTFSPTLVQSYNGTISVTSNKTSGTSTKSVTGSGTAAATAIIELTANLAFGTVAVGGTPTRTLAIKNSGNSTLTVSSITYPSGFTGAFAGTIAAGATHNVTVTFTPLAAVTYSGTVTVASDATDGVNTTTASGTGAVSATRVISLTGNLAFGNVSIGNTPTRTLTISNTGNDPLVVSSITLPTGFTGSYAGTIAPSGSQTVTITFTPLLSQTYSGNISVSSDATSGTNTRAVSGTGVVPATKVINLTGDLNFGNVQKNHIAQRILTISNTGTAILTITNITVPTGFSSSATTGTLAPGASQDVTISFSPTAAQVYSGDVTVVSDKTSGTNTMACTGTGTNKRKVPFVLIVG